MRMSCAMMALTLLLSSVPAAAQTRTITGTVTDASTGQPLEGARVGVRGTALSVTTGADGKFTLGNVPQGNVIVAIRRIGNNFVDLPLPAGQNELRVVLTRDPLRLSDVVVTGQATAVDRRNLANAVATVSGEEVSRVSAQTVEQALQGKVVGASIQANSGAPDQWIVRASLRRRWGRGEQRRDSFKSECGDEVHSRIESVFDPGQSGQPHRRPQP